MKLHDAEQYLRTRGVLHPERTSEFDESRTVFNRYVQAIPATVVRPECVDDVKAAVGLARKLGLRVTVKNGGHSAYGYCVRPGALLLDMHHFNAISVDTEAGQVVVEAGVLSGTLDNALGPYHQAIPLGDCPGVGVAGLALGGGNGFLSRKYGLTCDTIASCRMVTAEGREVLVDEQSNPGLLWAMRGAGQGNFGAVTQITFRLHPVPAEVVAGSFYFPLTASTSGLDSFQRYVSTAPDELSIFLRINRELDGVPCARVYGAYLGETKAGLAHFRAIERWTQPLHKELRTCSYPEAQQINTTSIATGIAFHWKTAMLSDDPGEDFWKAVHTCFARCPNALGRINMDPMGGAIARRHPEFSAFAHRDKKYILSLIGIWQNPDQQEACREWVQDCYRELVPYCHPNASYTNYVDPDTPPRTYFGDNLDRLLALKSQWDPDDTFHGMLSGK